jgi:tetratricopeptide (TPR) repeat protein
VVRLRKKKEKQSEHEGLDEALAQIETHGDKLAEWVGKNSQQVVIALVAVLLVAGGVSLAKVNNRDKQDAAFAAVGAVDSEFKAESNLINELGESAQLANPESLKELRDTYAEKYEAAAAEHPNTTAGAMALFQAGVLKSQSDDEEAAVEKWEAALEEASGNAKLEALFGTRLASSYETLDRWEDAAKLYENLASEDSVYGEKRALADAARCYQHAGDEENANRLIEGLRGEEDLDGLPPHVKAKIQAL